MAIALYTRPAIYMSVKKYKVSVLRDTANIERAEKHNQKRSTSEK